MAPVEIKRSTEKPLNVEEWVAQIKTAWENTPEYHFNPKSPKHPLIICDGNRTAAKEINLKPNLGHQAGVETIKGIARVTRKWEIPMISFWVWSTENQERRDKEQVNFVMELAYKNFTDPSFLKELKDDQVKFNQIGRRDRLPKKIISAIENLENETKNFNSYQLNLLMDYGGRDEILRTTKKIAWEIKNGTLNPEDINEVLFSSNLDTAGLSDPDLIVRTGEKEKGIFHTSGLEVWQTDYSVWITSETLFPNLHPEELKETFEKFEGIERKLGR